MLTDELYNCKMREGWRGIWEKDRKGGREEEGNIFPLHACSCHDRLEYFSQLFQRQPTFVIKGGKKWKVVFSSYSLPQSYRRSTWFSIHSPHYWYKWDFVNQAKTVQTARLNKPHWNSKTFLCTARDICGSVRWFIVYPVCFPHGGHMQHSSWQDMFSRSLLLGPL